MSRAQTYFIGKGSEMLMQTRGKIRKSNTSISELNFAKRNFVVFQNDVLKSG